VRAAHPDRQLDLAGVGDCEGVWGGRRLQQFFGNLVLNAIKDRAPDAPVGVALTGEEAEVVLEEKNSGAAIERSTLDRIFDPLHIAPERR